MMDLLIGLGIAIAAIAMVALREIAGHEYSAWAGALARAVSRIAGRLWPELDEEWHAEVVHAQRELGASGLPYAVQALLSAVRLAIPRIRTRDRKPGPPSLSVEVPLVVSARRARALAVRTEVARRMRHHRVNARLSQERLAECAGVHRTHIGRIEREETTPSIRMVTQLAEALGVEPTDLLPLELWPRSHVSGRTPPQ